MNEFDLIARLTRGLPADQTVVLGPGDDCAVLDPGVPGRLILFKTDAVVEGIHFVRETRPELIGHKALGRCLSDIAAMGGVPQSALVTLALPRDFDPDFVERIYDGMITLGRRFAVSIVGGETTTNPERMLISVALMGWVEAGRQTRRSGAQVGDAIFVTGELGGSLAGRHLVFEPRIREARWLVEGFDIHAMLDVSDGLAGDLKHLMHASHVGAELLSSAIPISRDAVLGAAGGGKPALQAALTDGEDFELLFTVAPNLAVPLLDAWKLEFSDVRLSCVGRIIAAQELMLKDRNRLQPLTSNGYVHFGQS